MNSRVRAESVDHAGHVTRRTRRGGRVTPTRYTALLFLAGSFALSMSAQAGTLTSEFELVPGSVIRFDGDSTNSYTVTGGTIKVRYNAVGTRTPDYVDTGGTLLAATISHTMGKIVVTALPSSQLLVSGSIGSVTITVLASLGATGTLAGNALDAVLSSLTIYATLPPIASLPAASNASIYVYGTGSTATQSSIYISLPPGESLPGNEISRTFVGDPAVPAFAAGPALPAAALLLTGLFLLKLRGRASS